nr:MULTISPECIES: DUF6228 family protein [Streptomyces]
MGRGAPLALPLLRPDHLSGTPPWGHVQLTWSTRDRAPSEQWQFETNTMHAAGEDMRLTAEIRTFIASAAA